MGQDKALLLLHGRPLIEYALEKLRALNFSPRIVGSRPDLAAYAPIIPDTHPHAGPLGGIQAALAVTDEEQNLFLPVDLPLLPVQFIRWLIERAELTRALATIPHLLGRPQPLCAVYSNALLPHLNAALAAGEAKVMLAVERAALATGARIDSFDAEVLAASQFWAQPLPLHRWFLNLNTPADLENSALEQSARIH